MYIAPHKGGTAYREHIMRIRTIIIATLTAITLAGGGSLMTAANAAPSTQATATREMPSDRYIRAVLRSGGIPPCKWEDGSGQRGPCAIDFATFGAHPNADGDLVVMVPTGTNAQKRMVTLINR
jgi:hypothetical protein